MIASRLLTSITLLFLTFLAFLPSLASAQPAPNDAAQYHYELGVAAAARNNYAKALEEFQTSYSIRPVPRLLINIGRSQHRLGNLREAIGVYESYLRAEQNAPPQIVTQVTEFLRQAGRELQEIQSKEQKTREQEQVRDNPSKTIVIAEERAPRPVWRWLVGSALGAGGLSLTGVGSYSLAYDGKCTSAPTPPSLICENIYDTRSVGVPLVVAGIVTLAAGIVTIVWPGKRIRRQVEMP